MELKERGTLEITGSHGDEYEESFLLGYIAVQSGRSLMTASLTSFSLSPSTPSSWTRLHVVTTPKTVIFKVKHIYIAVTSGQCYIPGVRGNTWSCRNAKIYTAVISG